ncbi:MAG: UDP-N-acetylmuramoylalanyl-D-glutamate--2,6-diaminopimelate ligase, partial [Actinomycetota bacterium]
MSRCTVPAVTLGRVAELTGSEAGAPDVPVTGIADDSRDVAPGDVFLCFRGATHDGHDSAPAAVASGASAIVCERHVPGVPAGVQLIVHDVRSVAGPLASALLGHPSRSVRMIGVTGTNGKTSTASFVCSLLRAAGRRPHLVGTLTGVRTTPEAVELQSLIAGAVSSGATHVVMEVSSHALAMHRTDGIVYDVAVFTNLGRDHLDFHPTMEDYFAAKARLFSPAMCTRAVVNTDDPWGARLADSLEVPVVRCTRSSLDEVTVGATGVSYRWRGETVAVPVGGDFTVDNSLLALTVAVEEGISPSAAASHATHTEPVPGRFETVETGGAWNVVVDYAHTPDALERLLRSARAVSSGRVIVVFGCGGNRDRGKRPAMGEVAARLA